MPYLKQFSVLRKLYYQRKLCVGSDDKIEKECSRLVKLKLYGKKIYNVIHTIALVKVEAGKES